MMRLTDCLTDSHVRQKDRRLGFLLDWIGGALLALLIAVWCIAV